MVTPLCTLLRELASLIACVSDEQYCSTADHQRGTIGGHMRHILDHVATVTRSPAAAGMSYDARERGTNVETERQAAVDKIHELISGLEDLRTSDPSAPFGLQVQLTRDGSAATVGTTLARELAFVQSHTVHHNAIIAAIARALGVAVPEDFGYAPATLAHEDRLACAPLPSSH